jgi:hypothetical protein
MSVEAKIFWGIGVVSAALMIGAFLFPADRPVADEFPWHIEHPTPETTKVFGLTLGQSTPADAVRRFREKAEYALFKAGDGRISAEAYFEQVNLAGLRSKIVLTLKLDAEELARIHDRGLRASATVSGRKISVSPEDIDRLSSLPFVSLTLIPGVRVPEEVLQKRFGTPTQVIQETESGTVHHLYPQHALGIATSANKAEKQVLQYVPPGDFQRLIDPLLANGGRILQGATTPLALPAGGGNR